jgi:hypothetical protein
MKSELGRDEPASLGNRTSCGLAALAPAIMLWEPIQNVRFGSLADILTSPRHVRFTRHHGAGSMHSSVSFLTLLTARLMATSSAFWRCGNHHVETESTIAELCMLQEKSLLRGSHGRKTMIRFIAVAAFALALATSAQAMTLAPLHQPNGMTTQVRYACGPGRTRVAGVCVARTTIRHTRRQVRRCRRWHGGVCVGWY